jgi:hypothetical protein
VIEPLPTFVPDDIYDITPTESREPAEEGRNIVNVVSLESGEPGVEATYPDEIAEGEAIREEAGLLSAEAGWLAQEEVESWNKGLL